MNKVINSGRRCSALLLLLRGQVPLQSQCVCALINNWFIARWFRRFSWAIENNHGNNILDYTIAAFHKTWRNQGFQLSRWGSRIIILNIISPKMAAPSYLPPRRVSQETLTPKLCFSCPNERSFVLEEVSTKREFIFFFFLLYSSRSCLFFIIGLIFSLGWSV